MLDWLKEKVDWLLETIANVWYYLNGVIQDVIDLAWDTANTFASWWNDIIAHIVAQTDIIYSYIYSVRDSIWAYFTTIWDALIIKIAETATAVKDALTARVTTLYQTVVGWINTVYDYIATQIDTVIALILNNINTAIANIRLWVTGELVPINTVITTLYNGISMLIDRPIFFFAEILKRFILPYLLEEIGHAIGSKDATLPPKTNWWNFS